MSGAEIKAVVEREVGKRWAEFEARHPELAAELTQGDYVGATMTSLKNDLGYRDAVAKGMLAAGAVETLGEFVEGIVRRLMRV